MRQNTGQKIVQGRAGCGRVPGDGVAGGSFGLVDLDRPARQSDQGATVIGRRDSKNDGSAIGWRCTGGKFYRDRCMYARGIDNGIAQPGI
ncbi:hypothetical protein ASE69_16400 [Sphingomonas sp. Leaf208]|nr:hypothetical protein ASE69_16400 [Sphingomonas sp. Leaf208]